MDITKISLKELIELYPVSYKKQDALDGLRKECNKIDKKLKRMWIRIIVTTEGNHDKKEKDSENFFLLVRQVVR